MNATATTKGSGWLTYSGIVMILVGVIGIFDAIWAFRYSDTVADLVFFENNLSAWGWIWLIVGVLLITAGVGVFNRAQWARWTGVIFASLALLSNLSWMVVQPQQGLIGAILSTLVIYGLVIYGEE
jgi:hypothetical protein